MKFKLLYTLIAGLMLSISSYSNASLIDVDFTVDGDTWLKPWSITNNSTNGVEIDKFIFDLRPLMTYCFDISGTDCNQSSGTMFTPDSGTAATGYDSYLLSDEPGGLANHDFLEINFDDFGLGETFQWLIDVDALSGSTVYGNELIGSDAWVYMSDGNAYFGNLVAVAGNSDASTFEISETYRIAVSEPDTLLILGLGLMAFGARRLRLNNN